MVIFDHIRKTILAVAHAHAGDGADRREAYDRACARVDGLVARLAEPGPGLPPTDIDTDAPFGLEPESNFTREQYEAVVRHCQEYIKAGDIFQVVPSQRFRVETTAEPFDIYRVLRVVNPSPFLFYLPFGDFCLIGSSPEILVRVEDGTVTIRPLAGTRRRGRDEAEDRALADELLADPKERAEHIMLVDLGRNDVGRVAEPSTVRLTDVMKVERYSHVMHITSNVTGRLAPGKTAFDALRAGLPAGTVSGARRSAPCRSSTRSSRTAAGRMPAPSATSTSPATWTRASRCARWSCKVGPPTSRPAAASSTTASRPTSTTRRSTRPAAC